MYLLIAGLDPITGFALLGAGSTMMTNWWNRAEAKKNREFQERMSSTAHQREVSDLLKAGINPMARGISGASTPSGGAAVMEDPVKGAGGAISSALQGKMFQAQLELVQAQARAANASAVQSNTQAGDIWNTQQARIELMKAQSAVASGNASEIRARLPMVVDMVKAELSQRLSSAEAARAVAQLDKARLAGLKNIEAFEKSLGTSSPTLRLLFEMLRAIR